jgi:hypothetical protein
VSWQASADQLHHAGVQSGKTYPKPIGDHGAARLRALKALQQTKVAKEGYRFYSGFPMWFKDSSWRQPCARLNVRFLNCGILLKFHVHHWLPLAMRPANFIAKS